LGGRVPQAVALAEPPPPPRPAHVRQHRPQLGDDPLGRVHLSGSRRCGRVALGRQSRHGNVTLAVGFGKGKPGSLQLAPEMVDFEAELALRRRWRGRDLVRRRLGVRRNLDEELPGVAALCRDAAATNPRRIRDESAT
jgi:hypothetical protein